MKNYIDNLHQLEKSLRYKFKNKDLLMRALTHSSYANENKMKPIENNERLEFLGDSVISLMVSQYLYKKYPEYPEGDLTKIRAMIVCESSLAYAARKIELGKYILLGKGENITGGRERDSILADTLEAITGAIYIDSDFDCTNKVLLKKFEGDVIHASLKGSLFVDYKTELQERLQKDKNIKIDYRVYKEEGPDHDKIFFIKVYLNSREIGKGKGKNKKEAEQNAAKNALNDMEEVYD